MTSEINELQGGERLPPIRKAFYAAGELGTASLWNMTNLYLLFYYTEVAGLAPAAAGLALMFGRIGNAFTEPLIGFYSDRTTGRFGKRRPYLLAAAVPCALFGFLLFNPPSLEAPGMFGYLLIVNLLFCISISTFVVPYGAQGAELSPNYDERTSVMSYRMVAAAVGGMVGAVLPSTLAALFLLPGAGYRTAAAMVGALSFTSMMITFFGVTGKPGVSRRSGAKLWQGLETVFHTRSFRIFVTALLAQSVGMSIITLCLIYVAVYWLQAGALVPVLIIVLQLCSVGAAPMWQWLSSRTSKKTSLQVCLLLLGSSLLLMFFVQPEWTAVIFVLLALGGVGVSGTFILPMAIIPDICDEDEIHTGQRREGVYFGVFGLLRHLSGALGTLLVGLVLSAVQFQPGLAQQLPGALLGLRILFGPLVAFLCLISLIAVRRFPLTRERHNTLRTRLEQLRQIRSSE